MFPQDRAIHCVVSFLQLCSDGSLVDWISGVCPTAVPTSEPITPSTNYPTAIATEAPSVAASNALATAARSAANLVSRNFNVVIGVLAALFFCFLLLCCFHQYRRSRLIDNAIKELSTPDEDLFGFYDSSFGSFDSFGSKTSSVVEMSKIPIYPPNASPASGAASSNGADVSFSSLRAESSFDTWGSKIFSITFLTDYIEGLACCLTYCL